jgi:hypothetical protein
MCDSVVKVVVDEQECRWTIAQAECNKQVQNPCRLGAQGKRGADARNPDLALESVLGGLGEDRLRGAPRVVRTGVARVVQAEDAVDDYRLGVRIGSGVVRPGDKLKVIGR